MPTIPRRLTLLEKKLAQLPYENEPMLVSQIDGYLAGGSQSIRKTWHAQQHRL
ncbi:hypothetical protein [Pararhizobium sp.]|uniref:hypothetical protein n=1 Tax=Pararhizobium sp. TaxID=1977563 RepID=UPI00271CEC37|nr:hypothetical protein [Pararhizobium sp.]MDO9415942.1 hypothetical protein [Pararhizobium sp.]